MTNGLDLVPSERRDAVRAALASANAHSPKGDIEVDDRHFQIYDNDQATAATESSTAAKPVGLVYIGLATRAGAVFHYKCLFGGDREDVRLQAVKEALKLMLSLLDE